MEIFVAHHHHCAPLVSGRVGKEQSNPKQKTVCIILGNLALSPCLTLNSQLDSSTPPILAMVMFLPIAQPSTLQPLFLSKQRKQSENNRHARLVSRAVSVCPVAQEPPFRLE